MKRLSLLFLLVVACAARAERTLYVSDEMRISLRPSPDKSVNGLRTLPSGTPLVSLDPDGAGEFMHVRDPDGNEGWVLTQFTMAAPAARSRLAQAEARLSELEAENQNRLTTIQSLNAERQSVEERLIRRARTSEAELERLRAENLVLRRDRDRQWFLAGAGVLGTGIVLGFVVPRLRSGKRRSSWA